MFKKTFIYLFFLLLIVHGVLALGEDILSNCNLSDEESLQVKQLLDSGKITDANILSIAPLASNCNLDAIPPSAWEEVMSSMDTSELNVSALENNTNLTSVMNKLVGAGICSYLTESNDLLGTELPSAVPFTYDTFNFYLNGTPVAYLKIEDKKITAVECGAVEYPDYELFISDVSVIEQLSSADYPLDAYRELRKNDDIKIKGTSFGRMIKVGLLNVAISLMSLFG